jgi:4-hydroxy-tetrahydrodipicolinate synthase
MVPDTVARIAKLPNIVGIKEATGDVARAKDILGRVPKSFAVYSGDDETAMELMLAGGHGDISVTANLLPTGVHRMAVAAMAGDRAKAHAENERLAELNKALFVEANPIPVKWALHEMGRIESGIRLPMTPLSESRRAPLRAALARAGLVAG